MHQMATSAWGREAQEGGGGAGAAAPSNPPATTVTSVSRPAASRTTRRGEPSAQSKEEWGGTRLSAAGRVIHHLERSHGVWGPLSGPGDHISATITAPPP